ncbi:cytochrome P450 [Serendipita vermifera]|nr:cytochrome P450 [Serendipita vermifera]
MSSSISLESLLALVDANWRSLLVAGTVTVIFLSSYSFVHTFLHPFFSPLRQLKGPKGRNYLFGHIKYVRDSVPRGAWHKQILQEYGHVVVYKFLFNQDRLMTTDTKALQHVLTNGMVYQKPEEFRYSLGDLLGHGLLFAEGQDHKRQRRIMNPAFGTMHIKEMTKVFVDKSNELRNALNLLTPPGVAPSEGSDNEWIPVEMLAYLSCTTLDIIGMAGFNYSFGALKTLVGKTAKKSISNTTTNQMKQEVINHNDAELDSDEIDAEHHDPLSGAISRTIDSTNGGFALLLLLKMYIPLFRLINFDSRSRLIRKSRVIINQIGKSIVKERKSAIAEENESGLDRRGGAGDLLTLLIKANLADNGDGKTGDRKLSDEEVMNQIPTFFLAGHETTSTSTAWTLISLACNPAVQDKLRAELLEVPTDHPTMEQLNALSYLDMVVRESLRYHSVVTGTVRVASQEDVIPFEKPFEDKNGNLRSELRVTKGDAIFIPIRVMNTLPEIWGPDAEEFNPDRWIDPPKEASSIPNPWGSQLTFLAGPRSCIGFRFAIVEMKALLFALIRNFEFKLNVPLDDLAQKTTIVARPSLKSQPKAGSQLPMLIKRVK